MGISRSEMYASLGLIEIVAPVVINAYETVEREVWEKHLDRSPHGAPWFTSFHASSFPGDEMVCGRKALYTMMDIPNPKPVDVRGRFFMDMGKNFELEVVKRFAQRGILLSVDQSSEPDESQTGFADPEVWLTGNMDAIILPPTWNRGHVVEVKCVRHETLLKLKNGTKDPNPSHVNQCKTYINYANQFSADRWPHLDPVRSGSIIYFSFDDPIMMREFVYGVDPAYMEAGRERLKKLKKNFEDDVLPQRPKDWRWSSGPCQYCDLKKEVCKPDDKNGIGLLSESAAIEMAEGVRPDYDYEKARQAVFDRWGPNGSPELEQEEQTQKPRTRQQNPFMASERRRKRSSRSSMTKAL